jgi:membrane dipeptidase
MRAPSASLLTTSLLTTSLLAAALLAASPSTARADDIAERAKKLQRDAIVVDTHLDAPMQLLDKWADVSTRGATDHFDLPRAKEGGLTAPFFSIYVSAAYADNGAAKQALQLIDVTRRVVADHPNDMMLATTVDDARAAKKAGKLAVFMGIEGGHAIEDSLAVLREMYRAGVRYMTLTHTNTNHWADSSGPYYLPDFDPKSARVHGGLSDFGREVVKEMNRIGMIVDVAHVSDDTIDDVLEVSRAPVMASHSSCRALSNMPRNLTDDQIKRIAAKGGVVMINISSSFLDQAVWDRFVALQKKLLPEWKKLKKQHAKDPAAMFGALFELYKKQGKPAAASYTKVVDHIEHVIQVAGVDAVGLGTDFDGIPDPPEGLEDYSKLTKVTEELLRRGHSDADVKKILGENFLAFFARVEAAKQKLAAEKPSTAVYKDKR